MTTTQELAGMTAIVTGAARNIGRAIALDLAAGGAKVCVNANTSKKDAEETAALIEKAGGEAFVHIADVTDPKAVQGMVDAVLKRFGGIDILVNNAAAREEFPFEEITFESWKKLSAIILDGAFLCCQACLPELKKCGHGSIVNIGGQSGDCGMTERATISAAKAGLAGFTRGVAMDIAHYGITVNYVSPGPVNTQGSMMVRHAQTSFKKKRQTPIGRSVEPAEIAAMVRHLCGPKARAITGQKIMINGGILMV
ncbi:MAG: SDR family oxidoreductase [Rhodospirillales bacterium]